MQAKNTQYEPKILQTCQRLFITHLTFAGLELGGHREEPLVLDVEFGVELGEDEDLRAPVLGVRRPVLQAQQAEARGRQGQAAQAVAPLLLRPEEARGEQMENDGGHSLAGGRELPGCPVERNIGKKKCAPGWARTTNLSVNSRTR